MILVTGSNGQLGSEIKALVLDNSEFIFSDMDLDITDKSALKKFFTDHKIDFVVNCAAYTAVDKAEGEIEKATAVNADAAGYFAGFAKDFGFTLIQISTDFVFDGKTSSPYTEESEICPACIYGRTKADGENMILNSGCQAAIIRTSWLYSRYGANIVKTVLKLGAIKPEFGFIYDQTGTPTWAHDLAVVILEMIKQINDKKIELNGAEIFHFSNEGVTSWYDLAVAVVKKSGLSAKVNPIRTADYPTPASRPAYSVMDKTKIKKKLGITIPHWQDSLELCLEQIKADSQ